MRFSFTKNYYCDCYYRDRYAIFKWRLNGTPGQVRVAGKKFDKKNLSKIIADPILESCLPSKDILKFPSYFYFSQNNGIVLIFFMFMGNLSNLPRFVNMSRWDCQYGTQQLARIGFCVDWSVWYKNSETKDDAFVIQTSKSEEYWIFPMKIPRTMFKLIGFK